MPAFQVSKSIVIDRTQDEVFDKVVDFNTWTLWSPWLRIDREAKVTVSGDGSSLGSVYQWSGNVVGAGEIEHVRMRRPAEIEEELRFSKPFKSRSKVRFLLEPARQGTKLTWQMNGSLPWFMFWMRSSMESYVGMDYQRGLRMLRDLIERGQVLSRIDVIGVEQVPPITVCGVRDRCPIENIGPASEKAFSTASSRFAAAGVAIDGEMISVYHPVDLTKGEFDFTGGFSVSEQSANRISGLARCDLPSTRALHLRHIGSYHHLGNAWSGAVQLARSMKLKLTKGDGYEIYRNDPRTTPEAEWITDIYLPVR